MPGTSSYLCSRSPIAPEVGLDWSRLNSDFVISPYCHHRSASEPITIDHLIDQEIAERRAKYQQESKEEFAQEL